MDATDLVGLQNSLRTCYSLYRLMGFSGECRIGESIGDDAHSVVDREGHAVQPYRHR